MAAAALFVLIEGFFSGSETAITSVNRVNLRQKAQAGDTRAERLLRLIQNWETFLGTTLVGTNLAVVTSTSLAELVVSRWCPPTWQSLANTMIMTPIIVLFGEMLPKSIGRAKADQIATALVTPLRLAQCVLYPLVWIAGCTARLLANLFGREATHHSAFVSRDDLRILAELAVEEGAVAPETGEMLRALFDLDRRPVSAVMTPIVSVDSLPLDATAADLERLAAETGRSRFPVYQDRVDNIVGIVDIRSVLFRDDGPDAELPPDHPIRPFIEPAPFVPETKTINELLEEFRNLPADMAVVVDEHGGCIGIITSEDVIEEIVGDINADLEDRFQDVQQIDESAYECDGRADVRKLARILGIEIEPLGFETAAGLVLKIAGRIPHSGEHFRFKDFDVEVVGVEGRRVTRVRFRRIKPQEEASESVDGGGV